MAQLAQPQIIIDNAVKKTAIMPQYYAHDSSKAILNGTDRNVVCMIRRKRASNLVVYRANTIQKTDENGNNTLLLNSKQPIDIFWLKLSKQDLKKHRESGKMDDRVEITQIERTICYGISSKQNVNKTKQKKTTWKSFRSKMNHKNTNHTSDSRSASTDGEVNIDNIDDSDSYKVVFNALKSIQMTLRINNENNTPNLYGRLTKDDKETDVILKEIWVSMRKSKNLKIPKVDYVTIKAITCDNKQPIEFIMKK